MGFTPLARVKTCEVRHAFAANSLPRPSLRSLRDLLRDVEADEVTPGGEQALQHRAWLTVADGETVDLGHRHQAVRRAGGEGFRRVDDVEHLEVTLDKIDAELSRKIFHCRAADARERVPQGRRDDRPLFYDEKIRPARFGYVAVEVEQQGRRVGIGQPRFLVGQIVVHAAAVLHLRVVTLRWNVTDRRRDEVQPPLHLRGPQLERHGERVHANGRRGADRASCSAGIGGVFAGGNEDDQPEFVVGADELRILRGDIAANLAKLFDRHTDVETDVSQRPADARQMILQPEELVAEGAGHFGDGGTENDAGIIDGKMRLRGGNSPAAEIDNWFGHG